MTSCYQRQQNNHDGDELCCTDSCCTVCTHTGEGNARATANTEALPGTGGKGGGEGAGGAGGAGSGSRAAMLQVSRGHICDLLSFCVRSHTFRMKYYVLRNNVVRMRVTAAYAYSYTFA